MRDQNKDALAHLCEIQHLAQIGSWEWNSEDRTLFWSDEVYRILGMEPGAFVPSAEAFEKTIHPDDLEGFLHQREQVLAGKQPACIDHRIVLPDGRIRYVQERARLISDEQGNVIRVIGTVQDITKYKQLEIALQENEARLCEIMEYSSDAAYRRNLKTDTYDYISPAFTQISGYTPHEMKAMSIDAVLSRIHPDDLSEIERILAESMSAPGNPYILEYRFRHKDGQYHWFEDKINVVSDEQGQLLFRIGNVRDISKRRHEEQKTREYIKLFEKSFHPSPTPTMINRISDGRFIEVNESFLKLIGYSRNEVIGRTSAEMGLTTDPRAGNDRLAMAQKMQPLKTFEAQIIKKSGEIRHCIGIMSLAVYKGEMSAFTHIVDITERKRMEAALRESEKEYRSIFETACEGICELDEDCNIALANQQMADMLGYTLEEIYGHSILDFMDKCHERDDFLLNKECKRGISEKFEFCFRRKDSSELWAIMSAKPIMAEDGQFSHGLVMMTDITERKRAENQLFESRQILRRMVDLHPDIAFLLDMKGAVLAANQKLASTLKKDINQVAGANIFDLLPPDIAEDHRKHIEQVIRTGKASYFEDRRGDRYLGSHITPEFDEYGKVVRLAISVRDITERKEYENMLRQTGERYRSFIEMMNDGFVVCDKDMKVAYVNEKFCEITGYKKEELIGTTILHYFDKDNLRIIREQFTKRQKGESTPYQIKSICKDGKKISLIISPTPVFDSEGSFQGSFATIADITERMEAEMVLVSEHQVMKEQIRASEIQTQSLTREVEEYNHALKVLLRNGQNEKKELEENVFSNFREMVAPFIDKLKNTRLSESQKNFLELLEKNLNNIISPFVGRLKAQFRNFTPTEIQVAALVKEGKNDKQIADMLTISEFTVMFHRRNIRQKLGLKHQKINLRTYLLSLD